MDAQLKKGILDVCVLVALKERDSYGYQILKDLRPYVALSESTLYPILRRLTQEEYFVTYLKESTVGPARKYYHITEKGKGYLGSLKADWDDFSKMVNDILRGEEIE